MKETKEISEDTRQKKEMREDERKHKDKDKPKDKDKNMQDRLAIYLIGKSVPK